MLQALLSVKNEKKDRNERHYFHDKGAFMAAITLEIPQKHNLTTTKKRRGEKRKPLLACEMRCSGTSAPRSQCCVFSKAYSIVFFNYVGREASDFRREQKRK